MTLERTRKVKEIADVYMGQSPPSTAVTDGGVGFPFLQGNAEFGARFPSTNFRCALTTRMARSGDYLLSVRAPVGALNQACEPTVFGRGLCALRISETDRPFVWHALRLASSKLNRVAQGSTFLAVSRTDVEDLEIPWLEEENQRIASVLDTVDALIDSSEAVLAKLRQVRAGLLHDLLTRGLDADGQLRDPDAHPDQFKDSPLGRIPGEWEVDRLSRFIASAEYGISTSLESEGELPVLRMNNFANGEAVLDDIKFAAMAVSEKLLLKRGDVLFNRTNSYEHVGRTGIWRGQIERATFASYLVRLNPKASLLNSEFLNLVLNTPESQLRMRQFATPAVQQVNINPTNLQLMLVAIPSSEKEQQAIVDLVTTEDVAISSEIAELTKLRHLKSGLMTDLLEGRVRVPEDLTCEPARTSTAKGVDLQPE